MAAWYTDFSPNAAHWYDLHRFRASEAFRLVACEASIVLPRVDFSILSQESKDKTTAGTTAHKLLSTGKLPDQDKFVLTPDFVPEHHEVDVAYALGKGPVIPVKFESDEAYQAEPRQRLHLIGRLDYSVVKPDGTRDMSDLKTSKVCKSDGMYQLAVYNEMQVEPRKPDFRLWHYRPRIRRIYRPADFGLSTESLVATARKLLTAIDMVYSLGPALVKPPEPGPHCGFCPSRFHCPAYEDGYVKPKPAPLRKWLYKEMAAYRESLKPKLDF
jgi:hypothetical protein